MSHAEEKLRKVLNTIVQEKFPNASNVRIKPISTNGANYSSKLFEATIVTPGETVELFAKVGSMGEKLNSITSQVFQTEHLAYTTLSSAYEKLQDKHGLTERYTFPRFYKSSVDGAPIIVIENLAFKGYECRDRFKCIDWQYASNCVETLARFHALSLAFRKESPEEFKVVGDTMKFPELLTISNLEGLADGAMEAVDEEDRQKLSRLLEGSVGWSKVLDLSKPRKTSVIIHGDYRASNLLHKEVNGEFLVIPVDYQTARLGCPVADLIYFIVMGSDQEFRQQYYHQLVEHYYRKLALAMTRLGLKPEEEYGREEFEGDMKEKLPIALCVAATMLPFVTVDPACAPSFERGEYVPRTNELFAERFRGLIQDFKQWGYI